MNPKQLLFHDAARDKIRRGVDALAQAVAVTQGLRGRTVILECGFGPPQIVNSGVLVAKSIELEDHFENMGAQRLREVAGDGATTATVLAHGMIFEGLGVIDPAKVIRLALQNAASIASLILSTDYMIADAPKAQPDHPGPGTARGEAGF